MKGWNGDQVIFVKFIEVEERMSDLLDMDGAREGRFLSVVTL